MAPVQQPPRSKTRRLSTAANSDLSTPSEAPVERVRSLQVDDRVLAGRYHIFEVIGDGGMGVVYRALDQQVDRQVAIKLVRGSASDPQFHERFRRELEITTRLRHPSTIRVFEHGETADGRPYMVMELLTGESLADRLSRGRLPELEALKYARQVAESLSEAHENGIFHRDLKPENIFIETVGMSEVVKVLDFGIAGSIESSTLTKAGEVFGTPQYMSPEQCNGSPLDHRTDIYSLGCILYEMLEGKPPFSAETPMATMLKHVKGRAPPLRHTSPAAARVLAKTLVKDRTKRIQSAAELAERLGECIGLRRARMEANAASSSHGVRPTGLGSVLPNASAAALMDVQEKRGKTLAAALGMAAAILVGVAMFGDFKTPDPPAPPEPPQISVPPLPAGSHGNFPNNRALVHTHVAGAKVLVDGVLQGETPCEIEVPVGDHRMHEIQISKDGYTNVVQKWQPRSVTEPLPPLPDLKALHDAPPADSSP